MKDKNGELIEDRIYDLKDMDRALVMEARTQLVAEKITAFLAATDPYQKTIVFCDDINHAERMRQALVNLNPQRVAESRKYVMRITGDDQEGKAELDNFINPDTKQCLLVIWKHVERLEELFGRQNINTIASHEHHRQIGL